MREARGFQGPNKVPAEVYLPPAQPEACRSGIGVVVAVPIFSPGGHLQRAQPPDILAGISISAVAQMCEAVDEALHMQRIDKANCAYPEEALPSQGSSAEQREQYDGHFSISPHFVDTLVEFRAPILRIGARRLIQPAQVRPPEPAMRGTGNILGRIRLGVVVPMVGDPTGRSA